MHRSHRLGAVDQVFSRLGAELRRCHDCRHRYAVFPLFRVPLGMREKQGGIYSLLLVSSVFTIGLLLVLWVVRRLGMQG
jgi:hypothetical protein